jgi:hypothetical protein
MPSCLVARRQPWPLSLSRAPGGLCRGDQLDGPEAASRRVARPAARRSRTLYRDQRVCESRPELRISPMSQGAAGRPPPGESSLTPVNTSPVQVSGLSNVVAIAAPSSGPYAMALKADGTVWTWGLNTYGNLGNGTTTNSSAPVQVLSVIGRPGWVDFYQIRTTPGGTCVQSNRSSRCSGSNFTTCRTMCSRRLLAIHRTSPCSTNGAPIARRFNGVSASQKPGCAARRARDS